MRKSAMIGALLAAGLASGVQAAAPVEGLRVVAAPGAVLPVRRKKQSELPGLMYVEPSQHTYIRRPRTTVAAEQRKASKRRNVLRARGQHRKAVR